MYWQRLGTDWLDRRAIGKDLGHTVRAKLSRSHQHAITVNSPLGRASLAGQSKHLVPLLIAGGATPGAMCFEPQIGLFRLTHRVLTGDLRAVSHYCGDSCKGMAIVKLFLVLASDKTRGNGHELRFGRFMLDMRANTFPGKMVQVRTGHQRGGADLGP